MASVIPETTKQWALRAQGSFDNLKLETAPIPALGEFDVLVKIHAASLNYRDLMIAMGTYYWPIKDGIVPVSDFAGIVLSAGPKVTRFQPGQRVAGTVHQSHLAGTITGKDAANSLGALMDGALRQYGVFNENGLVEIPASLSYREGATLPCAALTAWNALYGGDRCLKPGETVVTLGTGGVSLFAVQFAKAGGAQVISTTSGHGKKESILRGMGVKDVINYKENKEWGKTAKKLSLGGRGADFVLEIGGPNTMEQSCDAAAIDGVVAVIGTRGGRSSGQAMPHTALVTTRRIMIGSRLQFEDMNKAIEVNGIKPVVDETVFGFEEVVQAFQYLWEQKAVGKVVIDID